MNEPFWYDIAFFEQGKLSDLYENIVRAVRSEAPHWVAFVEPGTTRNLGFGTKLRPFKFDNVVYTPHSYDTAAELSGSFDPSHRQSVIDDIAKLKKEAQSFGAALLLGEYGGPNGDPNVAEYMDAQYTGMGNIASGGMYWNYTRDDMYGMLDPAGHEKSALVNSLVRPYPERVAGDPISYSFDAASRLFAVNYLADAKVDAPTVISIPPRIYPEGYAVDCGGCDYEETQSSLRIVSPPRSSPARVVIQPNKARFRSALADRPKTFRDTVREDPRAANRGQ
jgi:endoglycosylceramidase